MENAFDELTEASSRRWVITGFCELMENVLTQCKEMKALEQSLDKILSRKTNLEKNIKPLMELKNTAQELHKAYTNFSSQIDQAEERI